MFICGNDAQAKGKAKEILTQFGWETEDMGPVEAARAIEPILAGFAKGWPKDKPAALSADSEKAMVSLVTTAPPAARGSLVNLASRWGSKALESHVADIAKGFETVASNDKASDAERIAAAKQLVEFRKSDADPVAKLAKLITPRTSAELANGLVEAADRIVDAANPPKPSALLHRKSRRVFSVDIEELIHVEYDQRELLQGKRLRARFFRSRRHAREREPPQKARYSHRPQRPRRASGSRNVRNNAESR